MHKEINTKMEGYMYTAVLSNGDTVYAFDNGIGKGLSGITYKLITHVDENDEIVTDGWVEYY